MQPCNVLSIAGSDSGAGAGIQADLKTVSALGGYGLTVITALTAQNGEGVRRVWAPDAVFVGEQLDAVLEGFPVAAAKTGMLHSAQTVMTVADRLAQTAFPLVVDPVAVSTSGHPLLNPDARDVMIRRLFPLATLITPNRDEAELFSGIALHGPDDVPAVADAFFALGARAVLIKGGHIDDGKQHDMLTDWLCVPNVAPRAFVHPKVRTRHTHGTGCTLSAAIATRLGQGDSLIDAVAQGLDFLLTALQNAYAPGKGIGPLNHCAVSPCYPHRCCL